MNKGLSDFISVLRERFEPGAILDRATLKALATGTGLSSVAFEKSEFRVGRGQYRVPEADIVLAPRPVRTRAVRAASSVPVVAPTLTAVSAVSSPRKEAPQVLEFRQPKFVDESTPSVPESFRGFVPFGFFREVKTVIGSKRFHPVYISGMSGNGKTVMVEQACSDLSRELIRVNISPETDEADLVGGMNLIDGNTVYKEGPALIAMRRGAILLLDEVDRGSNKLMCLQGILEGKPYFNKKTGEVVVPAPGFNVIATGNSKGRGSEDGRYLSSILDDAFLERFANHFEQEYPSTATEAKILRSRIDDDQFITNLVDWANIIRKTFAEGAVDELISTRRLVQIADTFAIFGDRKKSIELCVSRFDTETKNAFLDLYAKVDAPAEEVAPEQPAVEPAADVS
jgi:MoxR-like ATPase